TAHTDLKKLRALWPWSKFEISISNHRFKVILAKISRIPADPQLAGISFRLHARITHHELFGALVSNPNSLLDSRGGSL
ncbi:hypothetical protein, partial [Burkholderia sp. HI2714]|uniref:hypothetical protein n=1 Tax=Burkholderia sp. HI2714 TaxID=2015359 RepID=UPI001C527C23